MTEGNAFAPVWKLVRRIPKGRVMTYGQIAELLGRRLTPRAVGWAMAGCPKDVPWWRVVNAQGMCSTETLVEPPGLQKRLLGREGVRFDVRGRLDLEARRWHPAGRGATPKPAAKSKGRKG
jgi:methylated-DNA-protein-cysteine methyltransferase-like protein